MKNLYKAIFIMFMGAISFDSYCDNIDIAQALELENDDNGNDSNLAIPNLIGQMPSSPNAFDDEAANRNIIYNDNGTFDDLDISIESKIKEQLVAALLRNDRAAVKKIVDSYEDVNKILLDILMNPTILKRLAKQKKEIREA